MERQQLLAFITVFLRFMNEHGRDGSTIDWGDRWQRVSLAGLRIVARDFVEWGQDLVGEDLAKLDAELDKAGAPTMTAMRQSNYRKVLTILARGAIRSEAEWHVLNAFVSDTADRTLTKSERALADRLVHEYQGRPAPRVRR